MKQWNAWFATQRRKLPERLTQEALSHPFQPEYDSIDNFNEWAEQFLAPEELEQLHVKYGRGLFIPTNQ